MRSFSAYGFALCYAFPRLGPVGDGISLRVVGSLDQFDILYIVTSLTERSAERVYGTLCCTRGQAENLIRLHKAQLASDRSSYRSANANEMRPIPVRNSCCGAPSRQSRKPTRRK